jgi:hypothetical protein
MPRAVLLVAALHVPKYCLLKARGLAYVRDRGRVRYLGRFGGPESKEACGRFLIEWEARRAGAPLPLPEPSEELTGVELCVAYLDYAERYHRKHGHPTRSLDNIKRAIKAVKDLCGHQPAATFGPLGLLNLQCSIAASGVTRAYVNKQGGRHQAKFAGLQSYCPLRPPARRASHLHHGRRSSARQKTGES